MARAPSRHWARGSTPYCQIQTRRSPPAIAWLPVALARPFPGGPAMMGRPPRVPVDLHAVTRDVKARVRRVIGELEAIGRQQDPIFASPRDVFLELVVSIHELEGRRSQDGQRVVAAAMKRCKHLGCRLAGTQSCQCFGGKVQRSTSKAIPVRYNPMLPWKRPSRSAAFPVGAPGMVAGHSSAVPPTAEAKRVTIARICHPRVTDRCSDDNGALDHGR